MLSLCIMIQHITISVCVVLCNISLHLSYQNISYHHIMYRVNGGKWNSRNSVNYKNVSRSICGLRSRGGYPSIQDHATVKAGPPPPSLPTQAIKCAARPAPLAPHTPRVGRPIWPPLPIPGPYYPWTHPVHRKARAPQSGHSIS